MRAIASPAAYVGVSAALFLAAVGVALPIDSTRADDSCVSGPGAAAPAGQHWYYRIDRATHRKCWFTHAIVPAPDHLAVEPHSAPAMAEPSVATPRWPAAAMPPATRAVPVPQPIPDPSNVPSEATGTQPAPHITVLTVKPDPAFAGTPAPSRAAAPEPTAEPQTPQISARDENVPERGDYRPTRRTNPVAAPSPTGAAPVALAVANSAATASAPTQPSDLFFLRALAVGIAAALIVLFGKMAGLMRTPRLSNHPDDAWRRVIYEKDSPFLAPQEPDGPTDLNLFKRIRRSPPAQADFPAPRPKMERPGSRNRLRPALKGIEPGRPSNGRRAGATAALDRD